MPNFKSIFFKMAVLQGDGQNPPNCVCYPKDPCGIGLNHKTSREPQKVVKVVVLADILSRDFLQTLGNHYPEIFFKLWETITQRFSSNSGKPLSRDFLQTLGNHYPEIFFKLWETITDDLL